jgi:murein DD-endopeptidase MepM/ murein hydrolase activator NlpD
LQIIFVSRHSKVARTIHIMPRHLAVAGGAFLALVIFVGAFIASLIAPLAPAPSQGELLAQQQETHGVRQFMNGNLQAMAARLGELQAQVLHLDTLGERVAGLAGVKREAPPAITPLLAQGGPFVPVLLGAEQLQLEIDRLAREVDFRSNEFAMLESRFLERRLPTVLPVKDAFLGSSFGQRSDPFLGQRAMHEGIDFNAERGTPVFAAADGVVVSAGWHSDFGNLVEIDHGAGLTTRYAHLSRLNVKAGSLVSRDEQIGAVGSTGRSTGAHLHFEVRKNGVAQNPAKFLKQGEEYALLKRR